MVIVSASLDVYLEFTGTSTPPAYDTARAATAQSMLLGPQTTIRSSRQTPLSTYTWLVASTSPKSSAYETLRSPST